MPAAGLTVLVAVLISWFPISLTICPRRRVSPLHPPHRTALPPSISPHLSLFLNLVYLFEARQPLVSLLPPSSLVVSPYTFQRPLFLHPTHIPSSTDQVPDRTSKTQWRRPMIRVSVLLRMLDTSPRTPTLMAQVIPTIISPLAFSRRRSPRRALALGSSLAFLWPSSSSSAL